MKFVERFHKVFAFMLLIFFVIGGIPVYATEKDELSGNLLMNSDFENTLEGWTVYNHDGEVAIDTQNVYDGKASLRLTIGGEFGARSQIGQTFIPIESDTYYNFSAYCQMEGMTDEEVALQLYWYDADEKYIPPYINIPLSNDTSEWKESLSYEKAPADAAFASIFINAMNGSGGVVRFDNVFFERDESQSKDTENSLDSQTEGVKKRSTYYTEEKVAAARENVELYFWAKNERNNAVSRASKYLKLGDEYLWNLVTSPKLPRAIYHLTRNKAGQLGCPVCGTAINKHGNYPWIIDHINNPWKLKCPECSTIFPTNDFESYYKSGIDENGLFDPDLADKSLLVNELYPEKGETWGVDDGMGWKNGDDINVFIAYYNHWAIWLTDGLVQQALNAFRDAYLYTGDYKYAHAGIILLDRIADVYPDMDITDFRYEDGFDNGIPSMHTYQGKILHDIWETGLVKDFIKAYDAFFPAIKDGDHADVVPFLSHKSKQYGLGELKYSIEGIRKNIEDGILREVYPAFKNSQIRGNFGMHQATLALAAVVLDEEGTTQEMLDFMFQSGGLENIRGSQYPNGRHYYLTGGNILSALIDDVDRDGFGNEAAPGYNNIWINQMKTVADVLEGYDRYPEADLYANVKFKNMFKSRFQLMMCDNYIPAIGDSGACGQAGLGLDKALYIEAFERFGDPVFAQLAYKLNGNTVTGIRSNVFTRNPEKVAQNIQEVIDKYGPFKLESLNLTGYGLATLRDEGFSSRGVAKTQRDAWVYYGRNTGHGHKDTLNLGIHAFGMNLAPDLGYPEYTGDYPKRVEWTSNTISHNTVVVDKGKQRNTWIGTPIHFDETERVRLLDIESKDVYPQTEMYRRTTAMIKVDEENSYIVDFFRVKGGNDHIFSFHSNEADVTVEGLELAKQSKGTYAGENIPFGAEDGVSRFKGTGFHYLKNVERDNNPGNIFSVDWKIKKAATVHLRLTMLTDANDVALADGEPPLNKSGNPDSLKYLLVHRQGENLNSTFTSVIEPYKRSRYVTEICEVPATLKGKSADNDIKAIKVILENGRIDYIVCSTDFDNTYLIDGKFEFKGFFGVYSEKDGYCQLSYLNNGEILGNEIRNMNANVTGTVEDFTRDMSVENEITVKLDPVDMNVDLSNLVGRYIYVQNDGVRNACYKIEGVKKGEGNLVRVDIGEATLVRCWKDPDDFTKGYIYDVAKGATFNIPLSTFKMFLNLKKGNKSDIYLSK